MDDPPRYLAFAVLPFFHSLHTLPSPAAHPPGSHCHSSQSLATPFACERSERASECSTAHEHTEASTCLRLLDSFPVLATQHPLLPAKCVGRHGAGCHSQASGAVYKPMAPPSPVLQLWSAFQGGSCLHLDRPVWPGD